MTLLVPYITGICLRRVTNKQMHYIYIYHHHHHHISVMELGHLLTHSGLAYPEVSSKFCHDAFSLLGNSVSLLWVIYYEAFYLLVVSSFSCIPVICLKYKRNWIQHVNRMPRNRLPRVMKHYFPTGRRNYNKKEG